MKVIACVWDPQHTLARVESQRRAVKDGTLGAIVKEHGRSGAALDRALMKAELVSWIDSRDDKICPVCGSLCETVDSQDGIEDKVEATRDVADNFDAALSRTRIRRMSK